MNSYNEYFSNNFILICVVLLYIFLFVDHDRTHKPADFVY